METNVKCQAVRKVEGRRVERESEDEKEKERVDECVWRTEEKRRRRPRKSCAVEE